MFISYTFEYTLPKVPAPSAIERHLRPISLTLILSKCLERFVTGWVMDFMQDIIEPHQLLFGSLPERSTAHVLIEPVHPWQQALDSPGKMVREIMLDFLKAFDRVDPTILFGKMANLGLPMFVVRWLTSFLCERGQRVRVGKHVQVGPDEYRSTTGHAARPCQLPTAREWSSDSCQQ